MKLQEQLDIYKDTLSKMSDVDKSHDILAGVVQMLEKFLKENPEPVSNDNFITQCCARHENGLQCENDCETIQSVLLDQDKHKLKLVYVGFCKKHYKQAFSDVNVIDVICEICGEEIKTYQQWIYFENTGDKFVHSTHFGKVINTRQQWLEEWKKQPHVESLANVLNGANKYHDDRKHS